MAGPLYYVWESAIPPAVCDAVIAEWDDAYIDVGGIEDEHGEIQLHRDYRNVELVRFEPAHWITAIANHYGRLTNESTWRLNVTPSYLTTLIRYSKGSFYRWHRDGPGTESLEASANKPNRAISIVAALSDPRSYEGGVLRFQAADGRELADERVQAMGSVTVFPSQLAHCVEPVESGVRYSLAAWMLRARPQQEDEDPGAAP